MVRRLLALGASASVQPTASKAAGHQKVLRRMCPWIAPCRPQRGCSVPDTAQCSGSLVPGRTHGTVRCSPCVQPVHCSSVSSLRQSPSAHDGAVGRSCCIRACVPTPMRSQQPGLRRAWSRAVNSHRRSLPTSAQRTDTACRAPPIGAADESTLRWLSFSPVGS